MEMRGNDSKTTGLTLALECAAGPLSVSVHDGSAVIATIVGLKEISKADELIPKVRQVLEAASIGITDLDAVAVSVGPGSHTGIRSGVAFAKGLTSSGRARLATVSLTRALLGERVGKSASAVKIGRNEIIVEYFESSQKGECSLVQIAAFDGFIQSLRERFGEISLVIDQRITTCLSNNVMGLEVSSRPFSEYIANASAAELSSDAEDLYLSNRFTVR